MRWGINLRGDLAKLSNDELQDAFNRFFEAREKQYGASRSSINRWLYKKGLAELFGRGLFHSRIFYKIHATLNYGFRKSGSLGQLYMIDCELKDIVDEMKRRANLVSKGSLT